jgi:hypothetical protein
MKNPFISKKSFKRRHQKCYICGESEYKLLDVHRWRIEGKNNGKYTNDNCLCVCVKCHRLIHTNKIKIIGVFNSTCGKLLNYIDSSGKEQFK